MEVAPVERPEDQVFFVYDHTVLQKEEDDLKDAILYFFPSSISLDEQCALCGQLMGMVEFLEDFTGSTPHIFTLRKNKFAVLRRGHFTMALSGNRHEATGVLSRQLDNLYKLFLFYQGGMQQVLKRCDGQKELFISAMQEIWDCYVPFIRRYGDTIASSFEALPTIKLTKCSSMLFLRSSHLLQSMFRKPHIMTGVILFKNRVLCSYVNTDLCNHLLILRPQHTRFPCNTISPEKPLPGGVRLLSAYLTRKDYDKMLKESLRFTGDKPKNSDRISHLKSSRGTSIASVSSRQYQSNGSADADDSSGGGTQHHGRLSNCVKAKSDLSSKCCRNDYKYPRSGDNYGNSSQVDSVKYSTCHGNGKLNSDHCEEGQDDSREDNVTCQRECSNTKMEQRSYLPQDIVSGNLAENTVNFNDNISKQDNKSLPISNAISKSEASSNPPSPPDTCDNSVVPNSLLPSSSMSSSQLNKNTTSLFQRVKAVAAQGNAVITSFHDQHGRGSGLDSDWSDNEMSRSQQESDTLIRQEEMSTPATGSRSDEGFEARGCGLEKTNALGNDSGPLLDAIKISEDTMRFSCTSSVKQVNDVNAIVVDAPNMIPEGSTICAITSDSKLSPSALGDPFHNEPHVESSRSPLAPTQLNAGDRLEAPEAAAAAAAASPDTSNVSVTSLELLASDEVKDSNQMNISTGSSNSLPSVTEDELVEIELYLQGSSDILLVLFMDKSAFKDQGAMEAMWKSALTQLGELEVGLRIDLDSPDEELSDNYNFITFNKLTKTLDGNTLQPMRAQEVDLCQAAVGLHADFQKNPFLHDVTLRSHNTCIYGHSNIGHEVYYQSRSKTSGAPSATGIPSARDKSLCLENKALHKLLQDHDFMVV